MQLVQFINVIRYQRTRATEIHARATEIHARATEIHASAIRPGHEISAEDLAQWLSAFTVNLCNISSAAIVLQQQIWTFPKETYMWPHSPRYERKSTLIKTAAACVNRSAAGTISFTMSVEQCEYLVLSINPMLSFTNSTVYFTHIRHILLLT